MACVLFSDYQQHVSSFGLVFTCRKRYSGSRLRKEGATCTGMLVTPKGVRIDDALKQRLAIEGGNGFAQFHIFHIFHYDFDNPVGGQSDRYSQNAPIIPGTPD